MTYRVYSGPAGSPDVTPLAKAQYLYKEFPVLDEALAWARHVRKTGRVALLLEGDDGTRMDRRAIGSALGVSVREEIERSGR